MLDPQKTLEGEALLRQHRELEAEIAQHEPNLCEGEARLPLEDSCWLRRRLIESEIPDLISLKIVPYHTAWVTAE